jgi:hypothetical protein
MTRTLFPTAMLQIPAFSSVFIRVHLWLKHPPLTADDHPSRISSLYFLDGRASKGIRFDSFFLGTNIIP